MYKVSYGYILAHYRTEYNFIYINREQSLESAVKYLAEVIYVTVSANGGIMLEFLEKEIDDLFSATNAPLMQQRYEVSHGTYFNFIEDLKKLQNVQPKTLYDSHWQQTFVDNGNRKCRWYSLLRIFK